MVSKTKIVDNFPGHMPRVQFFIDGFATPYRLDRTAKGEETLL